MKKNLITQVLEKKKNSNCEVTDIKGLVFGDVHLNHPNTKTEHVIEVCYDLINNNPKLPDLDIIIIEGDLFDSLMSYNDYKIKIIELWMKDLLVKCSINNISLRVLEGTPSHDMKQSVSFLKIKESLGMNVDLRYIEDIEIEINKEKGWTIGYVPDEMESPLSKCYDRMVNLMTDKGLDKLDFMVMHGAFDFQFPSFYEVDSYDSNLWMQLVKYFIFIGHHHNYNVLDKIIATGSIDRLRHGEEKPKGLTYFEIRKDGSTYHEFIKNLKAKTYKTFEINEVTDDTLEVLEAKLKTLPRDSHVRFKSTSRDIADALLNYFEKIHIDFVFTTLLDDKEKKKQNKSLVYPSFDLDKTEKININNNTLISLMLDEMRDELTDKETDRVKEILNEYT